MKSIVVLVVVLASIFAIPVDIDENGLEVDTVDLDANGEQAGTEDLGENGLAAVELDELNGLAAVVAVQGMIPTGQGRIVNGNATTIEQFPWIVSMQYYGSHRCGGSIITRNRILTAAHCTVNINPSSLSVRAGSTDSGTGGQLIAVPQYTNHESYNPTTLENDISIMIIASPLNTEPAGVGIIPIPMQGAFVSPGIVAHAAGWGALCEKCPGISTLQYVGLPVLSNVDCSSMYGGEISEGMICAGFAEGGRDACQGDSGGPLNYGNMLIGVVSWGEGCARPNSPGVFTRVAFYRNWINGLL